MKKIIMMLILGLTFTTVTACGADTSDKDSKNEKSKDSDSKNKDKDKNKKDDDENKGEDSTEENGVEADGESDEAPRGFIIEEFLNGNVNITVKDSYIGIYEETLDKNADYDFNTFKEIVNDADEYSMGDLVLKEVTYGDMEIENSIGRWYGVSFYYESESDPCPTTLFFAVQELDGELYLGCGVEEYYRVAGYIAKSGILYTGGSCGAGEYVGTYYLPDSDGDYHFFYSIDCCWPGWSFYEESNGEYNSDLLVNDFMEAYSQSMREDMNGDMNVTQTYVDGRYYYCPEASLDGEEMLDNIVSETGMEFDTKDEVNAAIKKVADRYGFTGDISSEEGVDYDAKISY